MYSIHHQMIYQLTPLIPESVHSTLSVLFPSPTAGFRESQLILQESFYMLLIEVVQPGQEALLQHTLSTLALVISHILALIRLPEIHISSLLIPPASSYMCKMVLTTTTLLPLLLILL